MLTFTDLACNPYFSVKILVKLVISIDAELLSVNKLKFSPYVTY